MLTNLLLFRFLIVNMIALLGLAIANTQGLIAPLFVNDFTYITSITTALFMIAWGTTLRRVSQVSRGLNRIKRKGAYNSPQYKGTIDKMWAKLDWLTDTTAWLVGLGLIGTVVGFRYALSGIDPESLGDARGVQQALGPLMVGMKIALNTTIVGAILSIWNEVNQRMLHTAMTCMIADANEPAPIDYRNLDKKETFKQQQKILEEKYAKEEFPETPEQTMRRVTGASPIPKYDGETPEQTLRRLTDTGGGVSPA